jgi:hypothetical protein
VCRNERFIRKVVLRCCDGEVLLHENGHYRAIDEISEIGVESGTDLLSFSRFHLQSVSSFSPLRFPVAHEDRVLLLAQHEWPENTCYATMIWFAS